MIIISLKLWFNFWLSRTSLQPCYFVGQSNTVSQKLSLAKAVGHSIYFFANLMKCWIHKCHCTELQKSILLNTKCSWQPPLPFKECACAEARIPSLILFLRPWFRHFFSPFPTPTWKNTGLPAVAWTRWDSTELFHEPVRPVSTPQVDMLLLTFVKSHDGAYGWSCMQ